VTGEDRLSRGIFILPAIQLRPCWTEANKAKIITLPGDECRKRGRPIDVEIIVKVIITCRILSDLWETMHDKKNMGIFAIITVFYCNFYLLSTKTHSVL
jgi:hypothetical protein